ncbi:MAG: hypothetical protein J7J02_09295 [Sulfurovum sp.]|nr:hypothetical protein [Sulfurovum sp.]
MNQILTTLRIKYLNEYLKYRSGVQTFEEYQECLAPLDDALDDLALQNSADPLEGIPVLRNSSSESSAN